MSLSKIIFTDLAKYDTNMATASDQPEDQNCTLQNGFSKVGTGDVTDIAVTCSSNVGKGGGGGAINFFILLRPVKIRITLFLLMTTYLGISHAGSPTFDRDIKKSLLQQSCNRDERVCTKLMFQAVLVKKGVPPDKIISSTKEYSKIVDEQYQLAQTGKFSDPDESRQGIWNLLGASTSIFIKKIPVLGELSSEVMKEVQNYTEYGVAKDASESAASNILQWKQDAALKGDKYSNFILDQIQYSSGQENDDLRASIAVMAGFDPRQGADELIASHADIAAIPMLAKLSEITNSTADTAEADQKIKQYLETNLPAIKVDLQNGFDDLNNLIASGLADMTKDMSALSGQVTNSTTKLGVMIGANQALLQKAVGILTAPPNQVVVAHENFVKKVQDTSNLLDLSTNLIANFDPRLANQVNVVGKATIDVSKAIEAFHSSQNSLGTLAGAATMGLTIANSAMLVMSLASATGPSTDQQILDQLASIRQDIADLRKNMNERFDIVDKKLDTIFEAVDEGFQITQGLLTANLDAVIRGTQVGLNTQTLIITQTDRLLSAVNGLLIQPCMQWENTSIIPMSDERFADCVIKLGSFAVDQVRDAQIPLSNSWTTDDLVNLLTSNPEKMSDALYSIYSRRHNGVKLASRVVDFPQWYMSSKWYADFIVRHEDLATRDQISSRIPEMVQAGKDILSFRVAVANELLNGGTTVTDYLAAARNVEQDLSDKLGEVTDAYANDKGFTISPNIMFPLSNISWDGVPRYMMDDIEVSEPYSSGTVFLPATFDSTILWFLINKVDGLYNKAVQEGEGTLQFKVKLTPTTAGLTLIPNTLVYIRLTYIPVDKRYDSIVLMNHSFTWDHADMIQWDPTKYKNIVTSSFATWTKSINTSAITMSNDSQDIASVSDCWELWRNEIGKNVLDAFASGWASTQDDIINRENAYFSALLRAVASDHIGNSDLLYGLASGNAGIPTIKDIITAIGKDYTAVWNIEEFFDSEIIALDLYFKSDDFKEVAKSAVNQLTLNQAIDALDATSTSLASVGINVIPSDTQPDIETESDETESSPDNNLNSDNSSSDSDDNGGGAVDPLVLILLINLLAARCLRKHKAACHVK